MHNVSLQDDIDDETEQKKKETCVRCVSGKREKRTTRTNER